MRKRLFPLSWLVCFWLAFFANEAHAQAIGDYQSVASTNWNLLSTWNTWNGSAWVAAVSTPTSASGVITIQATHTVTISANVTIDEVIVNGTLTSSGASPTTIANGAGVDLTINGTFWDNYAAATNVITWSVGATWQMGATGTLLKTSASSSNNWQTSYQGGISNIPATAFWIIRRNTAVTIPFSSTTPASGSVYPNLRIENNVAGTWSTPAGSSITGSAAFVTVKGDFDIGGSGTNFVDFLNNNTNASPTLVIGNVTVRLGNIMRNNGTGIEIRRNLIVNGTISYDANDARRIVFSGTNAQSVSGSGTLNVYDLTMNKASNALTLARVVTIDNLGTFTSGVINTTAANLLIFAAAGSVAGANNLSYVDGPVRYLGNATFTFPVGEAGDYQAIAHIGFVAAAPIWSDNFNNGCLQGCLGSGYAGWTLTNTGVNDADANTFFVSCAENGNAVGACGTGCGGDATLHIANVSTSPAAFFFCPAGDCGAAYDAGLGGNNVRSSKRMESPTVNCTGYSNIIFSFKYMEGGATTIDNATAWYYDGVSWTQVADMPKTATTCGGGQGLWTAYSITLPASANNNPNVKVGFHWVNNDDGAGADPSFAVDNVQVGIQEYFTAEYFHTNPQIPYGSTIAVPLVYLSSCEYWILDRAPGSTTSTSVTLSFDGNSCPILLLSDLRVARYDGISTWQNEGNVATTGSAASGTVRSAAVTSFSPFTLAAVVDPLPVELLEFNAILSDGVVDLDWSTASETNNDYFIVERSANGSAFEEILRVDGAGTTSERNDYSGKDFNFPAGILYYRLKQVDYDGQFTYGPIRVVTTEVNPELDIVSTQTENGIISLYVTAEEGSTISVNIVDAAGRVVFSEQELITHQPTQFYSGRLSNGIYFIEVTDGVRSVNRKVALTTE